MCEFKNPNTPNVPIRFRILDMLNIWYVRILKSIQNYLCNGCVSEELELSFKCGVFIFQNSNRVICAMGAFRVNLNSFVICDTSGFQNSDAANKQGRVRRTTAQDLQFVMVKP